MKYFARRKMFASKMHQRTSGKTGHELEKPPPPTQPVAATPPPTSEEPCLVDIKVKRQSFELMLRHTSGKEGFNMNKPAPREDK